MARSLFSLPAPEEWPSVPGSEPLRFAAIDIGSNAVRLLFAHVYENPDQSIDVKKVNLVRMPLRLGDDAFTKGKLSEDREMALTNTMLAFSYLIRVFDPIATKACATSAMREARNGLEITMRIREKTGIGIEIIDGKTEADYIFSNHIAEALPGDRAYLYIDVGGGSTELTLFGNGVKFTSESFNIGTIRLIDERVSDEEWTRLKNWVTRQTGLFSKVTAIGSGGNINKIHRLAGRSDGESLSFKKFRETASWLAGFSTQDLIRKLGLKPDRADVVLPASDIYLSIMKWGSIKEILVPQIGLSDGLIHVLYEEWKTRS